MRQQHYDAGQQQLGSNDAWLVLLQKHRDSQTYDYTARDLSNNRTATSPDAQLLDIMHRNPSMNIEHAMHTAGCGNVAPEPAAAASVAPTSPAPVTDHTSVVSDTDKRDSHTDLQTQHEPEHEPALDRPSASDDRASDTSCAADVQDAGDTDKPHVVEPQSHTSGGEDETLSPPSSSIGSDDNNGPNMVYSSNSPDPDISPYDSDKEKAEKDASASVSATRAAAGRAALKASLDRKADSRM